MSALPKQVKALEERVSVLEEQAKNPVPVADPCPLCEKPLKITKVDLHRTFGDMGVQMRTHTCEACGHSEKRMHDPSGRMPKG